MSLYLSARNLIWLIALAFLSGCLPTNNFTSSSAISTGGSSTNPWGTSTGSSGSGTSASDNQCTQIDSSNPERSICDSCYSTILSTECPGQSSPSGCLDPVFRTLFPSRVNQCITASMAYGAICYRVCAGGTVLDTTTCECKAPSAGSASGSTGQIDTGLVNYGPPVVNIQWPTAFDPVGSASPSSCEATTSSINYLVQNRGDTVPTLNLYSRVASACKVPVWKGDTNVPVGANLHQPTIEWSTVSSDTYVTSAGTPAYNRTNMKIQGSMTVKTEGTSTAHASEQAWLDELMAFTQFPALPPGGPVFGAIFQQSGVTAIADTDNFGTYLHGSADAHYLVVDLGATTLGYTNNGDLENPAFAANRVPASGQYLLSFDFYAFDSWIGDGFAGYSSGAGPAISPNFLTIPLPPAVPGTPSTGSLAAGGYHTCVSATSTTAGSIQTLCWGRNDKTQVGNNPSTPEAKVDTPTLVQTSVPANFGRSSAIAAGSEHTCGIFDPDTNGVGPAYCWGAGGFGQIGDTANDDKKTATLVSGGAVNYAQIIAGENHSCAINSNQDLYCWGRNTSGQLGDTTTTNRNTRIGPVEMNSAQVTADIISAAAGANHTCAIADVDVGLGDVRSVYCWGSNFYGQLGNGTNTNAVAEPVVATGMTDASVIAAGYNHTCAVKGVTNLVYCWGSNIYGQLGDNSQFPRNAPASTGLTNISLLAASERHTCASDGSTVWCWGDNSSGQLGDGTTLLRKTPVSVLGLPTSATIDQISAGRTHSCALYTYGTSQYIQCWGSNIYGQMGLLNNGRNRLVVEYDSGSSDCQATTPNKPCTVTAGVPTSIFAHTFSNSSKYTQSYRSPATLLPSQDLAGSYTTATDSVYRLNILFDHVCDKGSAARDPNCDLKLKIYGENMDPSRSWGITHLSLQRVPICGAAYTFTDSKNQTSTYCMRFNVFNSCGFTDGMYGSSTTTAGAPACSCWAKPSTHLQIPFLDTLLTPSAGLDECPGAPTIF